MPTTTLEPNSAAGQPDRERFRQILAVQRAAYLRDGAPSLMKRRSDLKRFKGGYREGIEGDMTCVLRRGVVVLIVACGVTAVGRAQGSTPVLTLSGAIEIATRANRSVAIQALDVDRAAKTAQNARALRLPQFDAMLRAGESLRPIDFTVPIGALGDFPATGKIPAKDITIQPPSRVTGIVSLSVTQPLTQLHRIGLGAREADLAHDAAAVQRVVTQASVVEQVRTRYYQIVQAEAQLVAARATLKYLTELSASTERRIAEQVVLRSDGLTVKAKMAQQSYQVMILTNAGDSGREALNQLLGRDVTTPFSVEAPGAPEPLTLGMTEAVNEAIDHRPELRGARLQQMKAGVAVDRVRADRLPDVGAQLSYLSLPNVSFAPQNVLAVGVAMTWQPFDWGQHRRRVAEAQVASDQARLATNDAIGQVTVEVRSVFRQVQEAQAFVDAQNAGRAAEQEKLRVLSNRYQQDSAVLPDLLQQQAAAAQAESDYQRAIASAWIARAAFDRALGREQ